MRVGEKKKVMVDKKKLITISHHHASKEDGAQGSGVNLFNLQVFSDETLMGLSHFVHMKRL